MIGSLYRSKPFEVEAVQLTLTNRFEVARWIGEGAFALSPVDGRIQGPGILAIDGPYGRGWHDEGEWIVKHKNGLQFFKDHEQFEQVYEPV